MLNSLGKGAFTPLLSFLRPLTVLMPLLLVACCLLLVACSHDHSGKLPPFTASGYIGDQGVVRIWRKDNALNDTTHVLTVFSPWHKGVTTISEYRWQGAKLIQLDLTAQSKPDEHINVRFDDHGAVSFMQREIHHQKQSISADQIALYQYQAEKIKATSQALLIGRVVLHQGRWHKNGTVTTCEGETFSPKLDRVALRHIAWRQKHSSQEVSIAWLEAPEGSQLLLVANQNFCVWQPKAADF